MQRCPDICDQGKHHRKPRAERWAIGLLLAIAAHRTWVRAARRVASILLIGHYALSKLRSLDRIWAELGDMKID